MAAALGACGALSPPVQHLRARRCRPRRAAQLAHARPSPRAARDSGSDSGGGGGGGRGGGGFVAGVLVGGAVFGALGLLFAPQISSALLRGRDALRLPRFGDADGDAEGADPLDAQRASLNEKIAELNAAIDEFTLESDDLSFEAADGDEDLESQLRELGAEPGAAR